MDLSQIDADLLLNKVKYIYEDNEFLQTYTIDIEKDFDIRLNLSSEDRENTFLLRIQRSRKNSLKITLHHQDDETRFCLLRVDYNGASHSNPITIKDTVPVKFRPFAGMVLNCNHVHYHVEGYPTAAWAIPLEKDDFEAKIISSKDFNITFAEVVACFSKTINLQSKIKLSGHYKMML
ncbi:DUF6978 family protein [Parabacteroides bouchesdurhonensis]|uniref:DUF6978 family protein n=1 Tax=Parabacteroides bouchesdurhonensis TaxID=1936995 RepID=UPI000C841392|nr:hypothetical protein [Parabacteroides bouchesdurhonensis]